MAESDRLNQLLARWQELREQGQVVDAAALCADCPELAAEPPFKAENRFETMEQVRTREPVPPGRLVPKIPRDLETICLKCLQKEPRKRYESAANLADDLRHFLNHEPIEARPTSGWERTLKWVNRRPLVAALLAAVVLVTAAGVGSIAWMYALALAERDYALSQKDRADEKTKLAIKNADQALIEKTRADENARKAAASEKIARDELLRADWLVYAGNIREALLEWNANNAAGALQRLGQARASFRGWEHDYLFTLFNKGQRTLSTHKGGVLCVAYSPDGKRIVSGGGSLDNTPKVFDAETGKEILSLLGHKGGVLCVAFSPDGKRIVSGSRDNTLKLWDAETGRELLTLRGHRRGIKGVAFSKDGKRIVSGSDDQTSTIRPTATRGATRSPTRCRTATGRRRRRP